MMDKALSKNDLDVYKQTELEFNSICKKFVDRIDYIAKAICKHAKVKLRFWQFPGKEIERNLLPESIFFNDRSFEVFLSYAINPSRNNRDSFIFRDKYNNLYDLNESFPTRWLFESFEKELEEGFRKQEKEKKSESELKKKALAKLSKQEIKALGIEVRK